MIEFSPSYPEEPRKFSLRHGNLAFSLADNLHIPAPIKVTAMIVRVGHYFWFIVRIHAVSSILQIDISESSQTSLRSFLSLYRLLGNEPVHIFRNFLVRHLCVNLRA